MMQPQWRLHSAIRLLAVGIFAILVYQVTAASLRPPISTRLYGSACIAPGHDALFRVLCLDTDGVTPCADAHIRARLCPAQSASGAACAAPWLAADGHGAVRVPIPRNLADAHAAPICLVTCVQDGRRTPIDTQVVPLVVQGAHARNTRAGAWRAPVQFGAEGQASALRLWPADGVVVAGLAAFGYAETLGAHALPLAALHTPAEGPLHIGPDSWGDISGQGAQDVGPQPPNHGLWRAEPQIKRTPWAVAPVALAARLVADVYPEPRQQSLRIVDGPIISGHGPLRVALRTLPFKSPVHLDVWWGRALIAGADVHQGAHSVNFSSLAAPVQGPVVITAYRQSLAPDDTHLTQVAWATDIDNPVATAQAIAALGAWQQAPKPPSRWDVAVRAGMFVPDVSGAPLLQDSHQSRKAAFETAQANRRRLGQTSLVTILSFAGFCGIAYGRKALLDRRCAMQAVSSKADAQAMGNIHIASWLWPALGILMLMGAGLYELMGHLVTRP